MRVALLLKGGVSKVSGRLMGPDNFYAKSQYVNYISCCNSITRHIITANPNHEFDIFIHSWNIDLKKELMEHYKPKVARFDNNDIFKLDILQKTLNAGVGSENYSQSSQALSIKLGCELIENCGEKYDMVIIYRPDLLLWKDMNLDEYDLNSISINDTTGFGGDFHFVMSYENMLLFKNVYDHINRHNQPIAHSLFKTYMFDTLKVNVVQDSIRAGLHQEVIRKLLPVYRKGVLTEEQLSEYDLTVQEIESYNE